VKKTGRARDAKQGAKRKTGRRNRGGKGNQLTDLQYDAKGTTRTNTATAKPKETQTPFTHAGKKGRINGGGGGKSKTR